MCFQVYYNSNGGIQISIHQGGLLEGFRYSDTPLGFKFPMYPYLNPSSGILNPLEGFLNPSSGIINFLE